MDFTKVDLCADDAAFQRDLRAFLAELVTDEVILRDRQTGDNFDEGVHLALGARGFLEKEFKTGTDDGFSRIRRRIWDLERRRAHVPWVTWGTTVMVARAVAAFGTPELVGDVMPRVFDGTARMCLGYTEPEGGSDVATCKTRAVREADGSSWIINGSKMFTTGAHNCQYVFLLTNSDPEAPKHKSLSMFLVPLDTPGIEIQGIRTVDGDRTNIVYYTDVCVDEKYLLGEANGGWTVLRGPLDAEHGAAPTAADGLCDVSIMAHQAGVLAAAVDAVAAHVGQADAAGRRMVDDGAVAYRLGRSAARLEACLSTPSIFGRVAQAQTMRDIAPDLMDLAGAASVLPIDTDGAADNGASEYAFRFAPLFGIYGGTLEVFRNMIAQHVLGLGKPNYSPPARTTPTAECARKGG